MAESVNTEHNIQEIKNELVQLNQRIDLIVDVLKSIEGIFSDARSESIRRSGGGKEYYRINGLQQTEDVGSDL